jgi:orotate phosphoribosyltransferase
MNAWERESLLRVAGGHFAYASGRHGREYVNKDGVLSSPEAVSELCRELAHCIAAHLLYVCERQPTVVVGPSAGGAVLSSWLAFHLEREWFEQNGLHERVRAAYAEKTPDGGFELRRGYDALVRRKHVIVVDDVLTTGGSQKSVIDAVTDLGGRVSGAAALWNRGGVTAERLGAPYLYALVTRELESWTPEECPLCREGVPIDREFGRGREGR